MLTRNSQYYRTKNHYSYEEKMGMIQEYLTTEISMTQMVKKYHIGWSTIPKWMRNFGIPMPNEAPVQITMSEENKKQEKKDTVETLEARLQELQAELDKEQLCALFGKTRQAYYQRLNYNYQEYAEDGIILDLIAEYREDMGRLGGRKLWHLSPTLHADYTVEALKMAIRDANCSLDGLIHHSDHGCQYCCDKYVKLLQDNRILISMTESGNPRENAIAERVNGILKTEWLNDEHFIGMFDARRRIAEVIEIYNNKRPHMSLNYLTPRDAHKMHGEQVRRWRNYYKTHESPEQTKEKILSLTTDVRTPIQTSGL